MFDVATLGLAVDSGQVARATPELNKLAAAANTAEAAADRLTTATTAGANAQKIATAAASGHAQALVQETTAAQRAASAMATAATQTGRSSNATAFMFKNLAYQANQIGQQGAVTGNYLQALTIQIPDILSSFGSLWLVLAGGAIAVGASLLPAMVSLSDILNVVADALVPIAPYAVAAAGGLALLYAPALISGMIAAVGSIGAVAKGVWGVATAIYATVGLPALLIAGLTAMAVAAVVWRDDLAKMLGIDIVQVAQDGINAIIGFFVGGYNAIKDVWGLLPGAFADIFTMAMNGSIDIVQNGINAIIGPINDLMKAVGMDGIGLSDLSAFKGQLSGAAATAGSIISQSFSDAMGTDYVGAFVSGVQDLASGAADALRGMADGFDASGEAADAAKGKVKALRTDGMEPLVGSLTTFGSAVKDAFSNLGTGIVDAFTKGGNVAQNFFSFLLDKVGQVGESLLNTGLNSLLNIGLGSLFSAPTGGVMGNGLWGSAIFSAKGNVFNSPSLSAYSGQIVNQPTMFAFAKGAGVMGEAGPEAIMPLRRTSDGRLGVAAMNDNGGGSMGDLIVNLTVQAPTGGTEADGAAYGTGLARELRRMLPDAIEQYNRNPRRRAG